MILSFINIRKVPWEMLKTSLGTLRMLMNGKSCLIPIVKFSDLAWPLILRTRHTKTDLQYFS